MMKKIFLLTTIVTLSCQNNSKKIDAGSVNQKKAESKSTRYNLIAFPSDSIKRNIYLDSTLLHYMDSVKTNSKADYVINFYTTSNAMVKPKIDQLISVTFNLSDSIFNASCITTRYNKKDTIAFYYKSSLSAFITHSYCPADSILKDIKNCDFFKLPPALDVFGADGFQVLIEIKNKEKYNYIIRWAPNIDVSEKDSPKKKEIIRLCRDLVFFTSKVYSEQYDWCK